MTSRETALQAALGDYLGWNGDPVGTLTAAVTADPGFILGHTTLAALNSLGGVPGDAPAVRAPLAAARAHAGGATPRELLHLAAAQAWADGAIEAAASSWEAQVARDPLDLLALRLAHDTHFFLGASAKLRDVPLAALPAYREQTSQRGFVLGMAAFGLQEMGAYAPAELYGREAVAANPGDAWAVHAVAHVLEMQDRAAEGAAWLHRLEPDWTPAIGLAVHNWWHAALFQIELGNLDSALHIYDANIHGHTPVMILNLIDAAALLWRLRLLDVALGGRWAELAALLLPYAEDHVLVFNDIHIAMALIGAGDQAGLTALQASLTAYAARTDGTNARITGTLGLPLIQALAAFHAGDYGAAAALMAPIYQTLAPVGGSNAQRDLFIQTLGLAADYTGDAALAPAVAAARRMLKAGTPRAWRGKALLV